MKKLLNKLALSEKIMICLIIMLLIGVFLRREFIKKEAGTAIKNRIEMIKQHK